MLGSRPAGPSHIPHGYSVPSPASYQSLPACQPHLQGYKIPLRNMSFISCRWSSGTWTPGHLPGYNLLNTQIRIPLRHTSDAFCQRTWASFPRKPGHTTEGKGAGALLHLTRLGHSRGGHTRPQNCSWILRFRHSA